MASIPRKPPRSPIFVFPCVAVLAVFSLTCLIIYKVDDVASQTKTVVGHNLEPTPWHIFPAKDFGDETTRSRAYKIMKCSYLSCPYGSFSALAKKRWDVNSNSSANKCPEFFKWILYDLQPWAKTRISKDHVMAAKKHASFRVVIVEGKLYVDFYYACVQSRAMFTIWSLLQLLKRYPGMVPDVDLMFDCMDKPVITRTEHASFPLPLFRYCTTPDHFDIPFPDWSFWGWAETRIRPWDIEFQDIKKGSQEVSWPKKKPYAYWKGNPDVMSPIRTALLGCNDTQQWGALILRQNWTEEAKAGFEKSKLSKQCNHRYKIYAEGYAWSVSLKYILSCGSPVLLITPQYEDFFTRGLIPQQNYWPVSAANLCPSIKYAVDWGNQYPSKARTIGKKGQDFMESLKMDRIYDYMLHLLTEYAKLQDFKPVPPPAAQEMCPKSVLCFADEGQKKLLEKSDSSPSSAAPCSLQYVSSNYFELMKQKKRKTITDIEESERLKMQRP